MGTFLSSAPAAGRLRLPLPASGGKRKIPPPPASAGLSRQSPTSCSKTPVRIFDTASYRISSRVASGDR